MLGKVYWMMGNHKEACDCFEKAYSGLEEVGRRMLNFNEMINGTEIPYPTDDTLNPELLYSLESMCMLHTVVYAMYYATPMFMIKADAMGKYYAKDDLRLYFVSGLKNGKTAHAKFSISELYYLNLSKMVSEFGVTVPELYLMYAESSARCNDTQKAADILEEFRKNRMPASSASLSSSPDTFSGKKSFNGSTSSAEDLIRFAVEERFREYLGYGNIWFDMRRLWDDPLFQELKSMYTHSVGEEVHTLTKERLTMAIPPNILSWHPEYQTK